MRNGEGMQARSWFSFNLGPHADLQVPRNLRQDCPLITLRCSETNWNGFSHVPAA